MFQIKFNVHDEMKSLIIDAFKGTSLFLQVEKIPVYRFYQKDDLDIWFCEGLPQSGLMWAAEEILQSARERNAYFIFTLPWYMSEYSVKTFCKMFKDFKPSFVSFESIIVLANTPDELESLKKYGFVNSFLCNQNCWIDWTKFQLLDCSKKYDLVVNCRPEGWKRPYLAKNVKNKAFIKGNNFRKNDFFDLTQLSPEYINDQRITPEEVNIKLCESYVGGIFSAEEGACYSSSEYLLSGLPVVSTTSKGGRDFWYTDYNSRVVDDNAEEVSKAVAELKVKLISGKIVPLEIRNQHIKLQKKLRIEFVETVSKLIGCNEIDFGEHLTNYYFNKMVKYSEYEVLGEK